MGMRSAVAVARAPGTLATLLIHLRLPFQLLLAPVYLWGWLLSGGGWHLSVLLGFAAFHLFLYGGATAYNSYYDRDEGPVGGLEHPPPVVGVLLPFSLAVKGLGWLLAALVNPWFFTIYGGFLVLSLAYSHPRTRWKGRPIPSLLTVGIGQGVLAFLGAWAANRGGLAEALSPVGVLGAIAAALLILSLYPLTQVYQVDEDRQRGDRTVAVAWGTRWCFASALTFLVVGGAAFVAAVALSQGAGDAVVVGLALLAQAGVVAWWGRHFDPGAVLANYRRVMRLNLVSAVALGGYLLVRLWPV